MTQQLPKSWSAPASCPARPEMTALAPESGSQCGKLHRAEWPDSSEKTQAGNLSLDKPFPEDETLFSAVCPHFSPFLTAICCVVLQNQPKYTNIISVQYKNTGSSVRRETFCQSAFKVLFCRINSTMLEKAIYKNCFPLSPYFSVNSLLDLTFLPLLEGIHLLCQYWR